MELIKITESKGQKTVSAKELYEFLGYDKSQWKRWYARNIENNDFASENNDWCSLDIESSDSKKGNFGKDFALSIDFAKRLSMMAKTEKGEEARRYFIECERQSKSLQFMIPDNLGDALLLAGELAKQNEQAQKQLELANTTIKKQAPIVKYAEEVLDSNTLITVNSIAQDLRMSAIQLNKLLMSNGIMYKQGKEYLLYSKYRDQDLAQTKTFPYLNSKGEQSTRRHLYWTEKGKKIIHSLVTNQLSIN